MNSAILAFKRYKETFLIYTELNKHENEQVGLWDTKITVEEMRQVKNIYGKSYPFLLSVHKRIKSGNYRGDSIFQIFFKCGKIVLILKDNGPIFQVETNIFPFSRSVFFF